MPSSNRLARHFCWFFIAFDVSEDTLPPVVRSITSSDIQHHHETDPGRYVILGYCRFKRAQTFVSLAKLVPFSIQWIPALHACELGLKYNIQFAKWATDTFDVSVYLTEHAPYPWIQMSTELKLIKRAQKASLVTHIPGSLSIFKAEGRVWFRLTSNKLTN